MDTSKVPKELIEKMADAMVAKKHIITEVPELKKYEIVERQAAYWEATALAQAIRYGV